jgi:hypothetical protein
MGMSKHTTINNLPVEVREDGSIDVARNSMNVCTAEGEFERAMRAEGDRERADPVGYAIGQMEFKWKSVSNRFNSCYSYGDQLQFYMKQTYWPQIEAKMQEKGLPNLADYMSAYNKYSWDLRIKLMDERPRLAKTMHWFPYFKENEAMIRAFCKGTRPPVHDGPHQSWCRISRRCVSGRNQAEDGSR